jgi:hypothetical protein
MNIEVVHHEMDRLSCRVLQRQFADASRKLKSGTIRRRKGEMATGLRLYRAENIGRATPFVFAILPCLPPRLGRRPRATSACSVMGFSSTHTTGSLGS